MYSMNRVSELGQIRRDMYGVAENHVEDIFLHFLPLETISKIVLMDDGVMRSYKWHE
jgi:hypothetical protein